MVFEVALGLHISEIEARNYPVSKMVERFDWLSEWQWEETIQTVSAMQLGVTRALAVAFGKKGTKLPDLPSYDEVLRRHRREKPPLPDWMLEFEQVNKDRAVQIATVRQEVKRGN